MSSSEFGAADGVGPSVLFCLGTDWFALSPEEFHAAMIRGRELATKREWH